MSKSDLKWLEVIEACRPDRDDPRRSETVEALPELRELGEAIKGSDALRQRYESVQRADARMRDAFHDVECPTGLATRILDNLPGAAEDPLAAQGTLEPAEGVPLPASTRRTGRRAWLMSAALTAVAACLAVGGFRYWTTPRYWTLQEVLVAIPHWEKECDPATWRLTAVPKHRPPSQLLAYAPNRLNAIDLKEDPDAVVYGYDDVLSRSRGRVLLFVVRGRGSDLPETPPRTPQLDTGGIRVGVWKEGDLIYSLVVMGDRRGYDRATGHANIRAT